MLSLLSTGCVTRDACQTQANHLSTLVIGATITVAIGVAMEAVELFHDSLAWIGRRRAKKGELSNFRELAEYLPVGRHYQPPANRSSSDHPVWVKGFMRFGLILVVVGVVGEWKYGAKLEDTHNDIHKFDIAQLTETRIEADEAVLEAYKTVSFLSDRRLNDPRKFVEALKGKPKARVELWYNPNDSEAWTFAREIYWWLGEGPSKGEGAGWQVSTPIPIPANEGTLTMGAYATAPIGMRFDGTGTRSGLTFIARNLIHNTTNRKTALGELTDLLGQSIYPLGTRSTSFSGAENPSLPGDLIIVVVGPKPTWYFGLDEQRKAKASSSNKPKNN